MLGSSWFRSSKTSAESPEARDSVNEEQSWPQSQARHEDARVTDKPATAALGLSTPHDAVLADLHGNVPSVDRLGKANVGGRALDAFRSDIHVTEALDPNASASAVTGPPTPIPEPLYDPFTGSLLGILEPPPSVAAFEHPTNTLNDPESTKDALWGHLATIRQLQSDIATMHVRMEGIGVSDGKKRTMGFGPKAQRVTSATMKLKEREDVWDTEVDGDGNGKDDGEAERKRARDEEFDKLADRFSGRREQIDEIMNKLDELSQTVTSFHALRTPTIDFASRSNTTNSNASTSSTTQAAPASHHQDPQSRGDALFSSNTSEQTDTTRRPPLGPMLTTQVGEHGGAEALMESPAEMKGSTFSR